MLGSLTPEESVAFLEKQHFGRLGCHADNRTYVVPISFAYHQGQIIGQTKDGLKIQMLRKNPSVCIEVDQIDGIADWKSVILWGSFQELSGPTAAEAMRVLIDKHAPLMENLCGSRSLREVTPRRQDGLPQVDIVYSIQIEEVTGRFESSRCPNCTKNKIQNLAIVS